MVSGVLFGAPAPRDAPDELRNGQRLWWEDLLTFLMVRLNAPWPTEVSDRDLTVAQDTRTRGGDLKSNLYRRIRVRHGRRILGRVCFAWGNEIYLGCRYEVLFFAACIVSCRWNSRLRIFPRKYLTHTPLIGKILQRYCLHKFASLKLHTARDRGPCLVKTYHQI